MQFVNQKKWFYKKFINKSKRLKLGLNNLYIFPNLFGFYWILASIFIYILGVNIENNFTIFTCYLMQTLFILSLFLTHFNIHGLEIISKEQEISFAGTLSKYKIEFFSNRSRSNLKVKFLNNENEFITIDTLEGKMISFIPVRIKKRGIYKPEIIYGESSAPFSLFNCWFYWKPIDNIIIAPKTRYRNSYYYDYNNFIINKKGSSNTNKNIEELKDLKPYNKEDKKSLIHWKSFARSRNLLSKDFENLISENQWLRLNKEIPLEEALENLCFEIHYHYKSNNSYGIKLSSNKIIYPNNSKQHYIKSLIMLAGYKNE